MIMNDDDDYNNNNNDNNDDDYDGGNDNDMIMIMMIMMVPKLRVKATPGRPVCISMITMTLGIPMKLGGIPY